MKKSLIIKSMTAGAIAILLCVLAVMPAFGMGFMAVPGALCYGTAPLNENSALQLESLQVSVAIPEAPDHLYGNEQAIWESYTVMTSKYALYNPTEQSVTEIMAIPFGALPDYTYDEDDTSPVLPHEGAYSIAFKGKEITPVIRHTFSENVLRNGKLYEPMDNSAWDSVQRLRDDQMADGIYYPEQTVTVYTYKVSNPKGIDGNEFSLRTGRIPSVDISKTRIYTDCGGASDGGLIGYAGEHGEQFCVYVIGQDIGELQWQAITWDNDVVLDSVTVSLQDMTQTTFEDLAMRYYTPACGATGIDWYNAVYTYFAGGYVSNGITDPFAPSSFDISDHLQGWLLYEITLAPGEHAELVTKTPAFPDIINRCEPNIYEYGYDLVGLTRFASVGTVEISVNTPCYTMENSSYYYVCQIPAGEYSLTLDKIERPVIVFSICEKQQVTDIPSVMVYGGLILLALLGFVGLVLAGVLIGFFIHLVMGGTVLGVGVFLSAKQKKKQREKQTKQDHEE